MNDDTTRRRRQKLVAKVLGLSALGALVYRLSQGHSVDDLRKVGDSIPNDGLSDVVATTFRTVS